MVKFYKENFNLFTAYGRNYLDDLNECQDVVQDVFIKYWDKLSEIGNDIQVKAFLYKAIRNHCLNRKRHNMVKNTYLQQSRYDIDSEEYFLDAIIREESSFLMYKEINSLPEMGKKVLILSLDNKSNEEIADTLSISVNTVKTHKQRSYSRIRERLMHLYLLIFVIRAKP